MMGMMRTVLKFHHLALVAHTHTQIVGTEMIESPLNYLVTLPKDVAPLRVAQDHPVHTTVFDHRRAADEIDRKHCSNNIKYIL